MPNIINYGINLPFNKPHKSEIKYYGKKKIKVK